MSDKNSNNKYIPFFEQLKERTPTPESAQVKNSLLVFLQEAQNPEIKQSVLENLETREKTEMGFASCQLLFYFKEDKATIKLYDERKKVPVMDISLRALKGLMHQ